MTATSDNAARVLQALQRTTSARRIDLMHACHLTRTEVAQALEDLMQARLVQAFSGRTRYTLRTPFCPPAATPADTSGLADDTHAPERHPCAGSLSALAHTGASA